MKVDPIWLKITGSDNIGLEKLLEYLEKCLRCAQSHIFHQIPARPN